VSPVIADVLILVPTALEGQLIFDIVRRKIPRLEIELCGFGPLAAAARTAELIARRQPDRVLLLGIAGSIDPQLELGAAYQFSEVACFGVGVGSGGDYQTMAEMGWQHWSEDPCVGDTLALSMSPASGNLCGQLLTVCTAANSAQDIQARKGKFPGAMAEDMEGFAVALACRLAGKPLTIVRGISNVAGDRRRQHWQISSALRSAAQLAIQVLDL
jgi:futalosine hydrolase